jgi:hypothetical protein
MSKRLGMSEAHPFAMVAGVRPKSRSWATVSRGYVSLRVETKPSSASQEHCGRA